MDENPYQSPREVEPVVIVTAELSLWQEMGRIARYWLVIAVPVALASVFGASLLRWLVILTDVQ